MGLGGTAPPPERSPVSFTRNEPLQGTERSSRRGQLGLQKWSGTGSVSRTARERNGRHRVHPVFYLLRSTSAGPWRWRSGLKRGPGGGANFSHEPRWQKRAQRGARRDQMEGPTGTGDPCTLGDDPPLGCTCDPHGASGSPTGRPWGTREQKRAPAWAQFASQRGPGASMTEEEDDNEE